MPARSSSPATYPEVYARDQKVFRAWLKKHHATSPGIWLVYYKKGSGKASVTYREALDEALCFGWIDSRVNAIDDERYRQIFTPRRPKSVWSKINKGHIERLIAEGRMMPAGQAAIDAAKADGSWHSLDDIEDLAPPPEFARALRRNKLASARFEAMSPASRKLFIGWVATAKRDETRQKRIAESVQHIAAGTRPGFAVPLKKRAAMAAVAPATKRTRRA
jgi:uncharacterized protein YdeI (YjbR/CyaY-like superfamily)